MRIYIIGSDGITLWRKAPTTVNDGEIAVASNEELHAAPLSAKRLLGLWNALPGVEKRKKVGDRDALIDQLWSAIEKLPDPQSDARRRFNSSPVVWANRVDPFGLADGCGRSAMAGPDDFFLQSAKLTLTGIRVRRGHRARGSGSLDEH
jgi:hypothetical protein